MSYILGLDPSLAKAGFVVLDVDGDSSTVEERGLLKTSPSDGILVQRLMKQRDQIKNMVLKYDIKFIGMEAPFYGSWSTEMLFALNQFLHEVFYHLGLYVVAFPPQQLKKLVFQSESVTDIHKPEMIDKAKTVLGLQGHRLAEDVADAYWAGVFGKKYYHRYITEKIKDEDLSEYELKVFAGKHTYTRGEKKGVTDYTGIIYRENEVFFDFEKLKKRGLDAAGNKETNSSEESSNEESSDD